MYLSLNPNDANPHDSLAEAYLLLGRLDEATEHYREAVRIKPEFESSYFKLGYIYALKEEPEEAMKWLDKFIEMATSPGIRMFGYLFRGFYHYLLGSPAQAFADLRVVDELSSETENELGSAAAS